ncbi:hypothetical protein C8J57DRAFT_280583 [Mycena rebaudengoi]|nr:hypothetical protein C8J57DRAFT_280583 [Mycena rebaudengoi]
MRVADLETAADDPAHDARVPLGGRARALRGRVASVRCKAGRGGRGTCGDAGPAQLYYLRVVVEALVCARDGGSAEARRCGREYGAGAAGRWWSRCTRLCGNAGGLRRRSSRRPRARYAQSTPRTTSRSARSTRTTTGSSGGTSSTPAARRSRGARRWRCHSAGWRRVLRRGLRLVLARDPRAQPHEPLASALTGAHYAFPPPVLPILALVLQLHAHPHHGAPDAGTSGRALAAAGDVGRRCRTFDEKDEDFRCPAQRRGRKRRVPARARGPRGRRHDIAKQGGLGRVACDERARAGAARAGDAAEWGEDGWGVEDELAVEEAVIYRWWGY